MSEVNTLAPTYNTPTYDVWGFMSEVASSLRPTMRPEAKTVATGESTPDARLASVGSLLPQEGMYYVIGVYMSEVASLAPTYNTDLQYRPTILYNTHS